MTNAGKTLSGLCFMMCMMLLRSIGAITKISNKTLLGLVIIILISLSSLPVTGTISNIKKIPTSPNPLPINENAKIADTNDSYFSVTRTGNEFEGYNLFVLGKKSDIHNNTLIITDMDGNIIKERWIGELFTYDSMAKFINPNTILVGTDVGPAFWNLANDSFEQIAFKGHHEYEYNPLANTVFTFNRTLEYFNDIPYLYDIIYEGDSDGHVIWSLNTSTFIPPEWWCPFYDIELGQPDVTHSNSIFFDVDDDIIYYNSRNTNTFFKIDHSSGEILWGLGEHGNFTLFDKNGLQKESLFYHAHSVERVDENTFIIFDNDLHNQEDADSHNSRILEITIDEDTMTAYESWSWTAPPEYYSPGWGDADRLPNGDRLGTFGYGHTTSVGITAGIIEVDTYGNVVWKLDFLQASDGTYGTYRSERFTMTPTINSPKDMFALSGTEVVIPWEGWYNYRTKQYLPGSYQMYIDDVMMDSGAFDFEKYWRPTNLTFNIGSLADGFHNATLLISNDFGQSISDTVMVEVGPFHIEYSGPMSIEKGQPNSTIIWSGLTVAPLSFTLTLNGSVTQSGLWSGDDINLDLNLLSLGVYNVTFILLNNSEILYGDFFWATVYPAVPPIISTAFTDTQLIWNQSITLRWNIFDRSPRFWEILIDGTQASTEIWINQNETVLWDLPILLEGVHNVTFLAYDRVDMYSTKTILITVLPPDIPIIAATPTPTIIEWGTENTVFEWEVHGASEWEIWKNDNLFAEGIVSAVIISIAVDEWITPEWAPGEYNLTLFVNDVEENTDIAVTIINIVLDMGDPYADELISSRSIWYSDGENAIGSPDGNTTTIFTEYGNGYVTLDMGEGEEIINGAGNDFQVIAAGGSYAVRVANALNVPLHQLGIFNGNASIDLEGMFLDTVRYVRIDYFEGNFIELDAIIANYYNIPTRIADPPFIVGPDDFTLQLNTEIIINWTGFDIAPWNYEIRVNDTSMQSGLWNGSDIHYSFISNSIGNYSVTLRLTDIFMQQSSDTVVVTVIGSPTSISDILVIAIPSVILVVITIIYVNRRRKN